MGYGRHVANRETPAPAKIDDADTPAPLTPEGAVQRGAQGEDLVAHTDKPRAVVAGDPHNLTPRFGCSRSPHVGQWPGVSDAKPQRQW